MMPYDVADVIKRLGGFHRSSDIDDEDYDEWVKALEETGRIIPYNTLPTLMRENIQVQTNTEHSDFAFNEWLEPENDGLTSMFDFNRPFASYDLHWRWDKVDDMWYFRVLFPFESVSTSYDFNQGGIVSQNKTFFDIDRRILTIPESEKIAQGFFDEEGMGYGVMFS